MKFDAKVYFSICKILDEKLTKEESDLVKDVIEQLSKENQTYINILNTISFHTKHFNNYIKDKE